MAAASLERAPVTCPHCGHSQLEPVAVISTVCRHCRSAIRVREQAGGPTLSSQARTASGPAVERRDLVCFTCGTLLSVPLTAESTMCKRCSSHIDLRDYHINQAVSKNFRTHGRFVVREKGYVFNTDSDVGEAVLKGRFHGTLFARNRLEIYSSAEIKGSIRAGLLVIPAGQSFVWSQTVLVGSAEIAGELIAPLRAEGTVSVQSTGHLFADIEAHSLIVEPGATIVAHLRIGGVITHGS
jgi:cytoskeletal protein CcmA (bactofilin family)